MESPGTLKVMDSVELGKKLSFTMSESYENLSTNDNSNSSSGSDTFILETSIVKADMIEEERRLAAEHKQQEKEALAEERRRQKQLEKEEEQQKRQLAKEEWARKEEEMMKKREAEVRERRYKRLMHLLKNSKMYSSMLRDKLQIGSDKDAKKRKKATLEVLRETNQVWKKKKLEETYDINEVLDGAELPEENPSDEEMEEAVIKEKNYFERTRVTSLGHEVSEYQPRLLEGGVMRDYQLRGLEWLKLLFTNGINGILADEMGLGKTIQVISFICYLIEEGIDGPFLIIAPLTTITNWISEFKRFAPQVPTLLFHGYKDQRKSLIPKLKTKKSVAGRKVYQVIITSYEVPLSESKALADIKWHYIIIDEGHKIKNHNTRLARVVRTFDSIGRLLLTGTPLQNNLYELWSLLNFILPEIFNNIDVFESWFDVEELQGVNAGTKFVEEKMNVNVVSTLQEILAPFLLRREKKDVKLNLPPKKEILTYCPMSPLQKDLYQATIDRTIDLLLKPEKSIVPEVMDPLPKRQCVLNRKMPYYYSSNPEKDPIIYIEPEKPYEQAIREYATDVVMQNPQMQLRKIVNHPYLVQFPFKPGTRELRIDEDLIKQSGKLLVLDAMLAKLKERGHKVVVFSTFNILIDIFEEHAIMRGYNYLRLDGNIQSEIREMDIKKFNEDPNIFIFYVSIRAGGLGINLTSADTVILYDSDWNPQINLQAQDRCHRIGQTKPVVVYRFCTAGTIDERIIGRGDAKRRLEKMIIQRGRFTTGQQSPTKLTLLDAQDLKKLLESTTHDSVIHSNGFVFTDEELDALLDRSDMLEERTKKKNGMEEDDSDDKENRRIFEVLKD